VSGFDPRRRSFRLPLGRTRIAGEVDAEIAFHIDERIEDLVAQGMERHAAREQALQEFGDVGAARSELVAIDQRRVRRVRRAGWWRDVAQDLRFGARAALRAPLFSLVAIVTLALGIGVNAALFSVVKPVLLDPLPYADQSRLVRIFGHNVESGDDRWGMSAGMAADVAAMQRSFSEVAAFNYFPTDVIVGALDQVNTTSVATVQPSFLRVLGVQPMLGRAFADDDLPASGPASVVILTHAAWHRFAAGRADIIGQDIVVNDRPRTVIGVLPQEFVGPMGDADVYLPLNLAPTLADPVGARRTYNLGMVGRLNPGVDLRAAQGDLAAIAHAIAREHPDDIGGITLNAVPLRDAMVGDTRVPLLVLTAGAILVLMIACANLASAMLARVISRRHEFAVRAAIGASRGRLARQVLTESTLLAGAGGLTGILLAGTLLLVLRDLAIPALPHFADMALDAGILGAVLLLTIATGLAIGLLPAMVIGGTEPAATEQARGASAGRGSVRIRGVLVSVQIALCLSLVVSAGLLARSLWNMSTAPTGIDARGVVTASLSLPAARYATSEAIAAFHRSILEQTRALPGTASVATASGLPLDLQWSNSFVIDGAPWAHGEAEPFVFMQSVSDEYFRTLGIPLLRGRMFDSRDHADAPPVTILSESMARHYWPDSDALGARIRIGPDVQSPLWEVVGIVADVRNDPARADAAAITYTSYRQIPSPNLNLLARSEAGPAALMAMLERKLATLDASVSLHGPMTLDAALSRGLAGYRLPVVLMLSFGLLALVLASVGVYAMFATMVAAREREFGVRIALGAGPRAILRHVVQQGSVWMSIGLVSGVLCTLAAAHAMRGLLFGLSPFDPVTIIAAALLLGGCAALAVLAPLRRATRVDPSVIMRAE
jgi:putative ABC transport system permease protein